MGCGRIAGRIAHKEEFDKVATNNYVGPTKKIIRLNRGTPWK